MRLIQRILFIVMAALGLIFLGSSAFAQDPIATERPSQSVGSLVLPGNSFLYEQGFTYKNDSLELDGFFRLGVSDIGELRLLTYYDSPLVTIGAKVNLLKHKNYRPGIAIKVDLTGAKVTDYRLIIMQKLSDQFSANLNVGYASSTYGIIYIGYSFADRFGVYLEGYFENDYNQFNSGLTFTLNSETQLDINAGLLNLDAGYIGLGFARRFLFKKSD